MISSSFLRLAMALFAFASTTTTALAQVKIVHTNDDGWAVANIRASFDALQDAGYNVRDFASSPQCH